MSAADPAPGTPAMPGLIPAQMTDDSLSFTRAFGAPASAIWKAWTNAATMLQWFGKPLHPATNVEIDFRVGGAWRIDLQPAEGGPGVAFFGEYTEIDPGRRIVMTWRHEGPTPVGSTTVTLGFRDSGSGSELSVHQVGFEATEARDGHHVGWSTCLVTLDEMAASL